MDVIYAPRAAEGKGFEIRKGRFGREIQGRTIVLTAAKDRPAHASRATWDMLARGDVKRIERTNRTIPPKVVKGTVIGESKL